MIAQFGKVTEGSFVAQTEMKLDAKLAVWQLERWGYKPIPELGDGVYVSLQPHSKQPVVVVLYKD